MFKTKKFIGLFVLASVSIALSILFSDLDFKIWNSISYHARAEWLATLEIGQLLGAYILTLSGIIIALYYNTQEEKNSKLKSYIGFSLAMMGMVFCVYILNHIESTPLAIILMLFTGALFATITWLMKKVSADRFFQLYCIALTGIVYIIAVTIVISVIGAFWGRTPPFLISSEHQPTRFYLPQGIGKGNSFPSLYVANASIAYVVTMIVPLFKKKLVKISLYVLPILWIIAVAFNAIYTGKSYVSDVLYACALSITLFYVAKSLTLKKIAKSLEK